jgi:hypothetical protein
MYIVLLLFTAILSNIVIIDAPSSIRIVNALPIVTLIQPIGLEVIHFLRPFSTVSTKLSPKNGGVLTFIALILLFTLNIARTGWAVFQKWAAEEEVLYV